MPKAKVGDINIHYEIQGKGETILMIPALAVGSSTCFFRQIPGLARQYRVIAIDNRGSGLSDKPDFPYSMEMMADDAVGLLNNLGVGMTHIYGLSMGGMIAQHLALRHPGMVASVILISTSCGGKHVVPSDQEYVATLFSADRTAEERLRGRFHTAEESLRDRLHFLFTQKFIDGNPKIIEEFMSVHLHPPPTLQTLIRHSEAIIMHDTHDRLRDLNIPTLVIGGGDDKVQPIENARILARQIPNAELVVMNGLRHLIPIELPEDLNKVIADFLKRHPVAD
jgi:pimeloyl-ACP methyl ester carboxylesterase